MLQYLKSLAEKAYWHDPYIHTAHQLYELGDYEGSLVNYLFAAEMGHEAAQSNAAWILDKDRIPVSSYPLVFHSKVSSKDRFDLAYPLWNRAANQGNVDARVKIGDYFYYSKIRGISGKLALDGEESKKRPEENYKKAAAYYRVAAENERSALAMYVFAFVV
jgi:SEL1 protein